MDAIGPWAESCARDAQARDDVAVWVLRAAEGPETGSLAEWTTPPVAADLRATLAGLGPGRWVLRLDPRDGSGCQLAGSRQVTFTVLGDAGDDGAARAALARSLPAPLASLAGQWLARQEAAAGFARAERDHYFSERERLLDRVAELQLAVAEARAQALIAQASSDGAQAGALAGQVVRLAEVWASGRITPTGAAKVLVEEPVAVLTAAEAASPGWLLRLPPSARELVLVALLRGADEGDAATTHDGDTAS